MRTWIAVGVVCLALGTTSAVRAQDDEVLPEPDAAPASVEMSLSLSPTFLLTMLQLGGSPGLGALVQPVLDVGFAVDPRLLFVVGVMASFQQAGGGTSVFASVPLSLLWYLETPRVGRVMPMLRVGAVLGYQQYEGGETYELGALARGGITWLADRCLGIRAELGLRGAVFAEDGATAASLGLDALVGVVLRV